MKKFLFTLATLLMAGSMFAANENYFYMDNITLTKEEAAEGTYRVVNVRAHFDEAVSAWQAEFTLPEGVTIGTQAKGSDLTLTFLGMFQDEETLETYYAETTYTPDLATNDDKTKVIVSVYTTKEYDDAGNAYGVCWRPGDYEQMWRVRLVFPAGFQGGDIVLNTAPACGNLLYPGLEPCPKNQNNQKVCTVSVEGTTPEPEVTEKPVITWEANDETQEVVITVTGAGEIVLYNDDVEVARGESPLTYTVPYTDDPEGEEMGFSATAQEEGKEVSEYALATVEVPGKPAQPEVTEAPVVTYEVTDGAVIITATGDGEVVLYVNDEAVENPYTIARPEAGEEDITIFVYATAQEEGKEMGKSDVEAIVVEAQEGGDVPPVDPHAEGYWLVTFDMDGNEIWTELTESNGDYNVILRCSYGVYGTFDYYGGETRPDIEYYIVVDGVRYGAAEDGTLTVLGEALQNPLYEGENNYVLAEGLGKVYNMGVAIDEMTGDMYVYAAVAGFTEIDEMNAGKAVAGVRYFNMAGQEMKEANGLTIVVTTYTDGTTSAAKVMK